MGNATLFLKQLTIWNKSGKLAMLAVANILVRQAFAVVTSNTSYIDGFVSTKPDTAV